MWGGPLPFDGDVEPLPLRDAARAVGDGFRLAWSADPWRLCGALALTVATAAGEVAQLVSTGSAAGAVLSGARPRTQLRRLTGLAALTVATVGAQTTRSVLESRVSQAASREAEGRILDVVGALELADVEDPAFQDRLQRAQMGASHLGRLVSTALTLPRSFVSVGTTIGAMGSIDRLLAPLAVAGAVPQWLLTRRSHDPGRALRFRSREGREAGVLRHYLTGTNAAHELRAFGATAFLRARHDEVTLAGDRAQAEQARRNGWRSLASNLVAKAANAPAAGRLVVRVVRRESSLSDAFTGGVATQRLNTGVRHVVDSLGGIRRAAAMTADYSAFIADATPPHAAGGPSPPPDFERIVLDGIGFTYPGADRAVLDGVDLEIRRGEVVALVGENGSGKTTLAKLLCSLYRPTKGTISWDGFDVADADPATVRDRIAVVFQDFVRYPSLTAAQNIGIGLPARMHDRDAIVDAAKRAGAHDAIAALPDGYDTVMSRFFGGSDLSTGQWQRVALARAFLRDAPLVVLDEPTAALDPRAERALFEAVAALYRSRSALLISHRLSSVRFADRICVLADGRIIETGTHDDLIATGGIYAELFDLQARAYR
jgi:ATP-binding cassette subfamily B protein